MVSNRHRKRRSKSRGKKWVPPARPPTPPEAALLNLLRKLLGDDEQILLHHRPKWLVNPATHHRLELDFFLPRLRLGIEFNGDSHFKVCARKNIRLLVLTHVPELPVLKVWVNYGTTLKGTA